MKYTHVFVGKCGENRPLGRAEKSRWVILKGISHK